LRLILSESFTKVSKTDLSKSDFKVSADFVQY